MRRRISLCSFLLLTGWATAEPYRFVLNGTPTRASSSELNQRAGDSVTIAEFPFLLDEPGDYDLVIRREEPNRLYRRTATGVQLLAARVTRDYKEKGLIDGLQGLTPEQGQQLRGVALEAMSPHVIAELQKLKPYGALWVVTGSEPNAVLPDFPEGLRHLELEQHVFPSWQDWSSLSRFHSLQTFRAHLMRAQFSPQFLGTHPDLRVLDVDAWKDGQGLEVFTKLEKLRVRGGELGTLAFARQMPKLQELEVMGADLKDIEAVSAHPALRVVKAEFNQLRGLPRGPTPQLQTLDVLGSAVTAQQAEAFRASHPGTKLLWSHQETLREKLAQADRLRVRSGGTCHRKPDEEKTLFETTDASELKTLLAQVAVVEPDRPFECMCCGEPTFEFYRQGQRLTSVGFHHGQLLRWSEGWETDCALSDQSAQSLVDYLAVHGLSGPKEQWEREQARKAAAIAERKRLTRDYPPALQAAFEDPEATSESVQKAYEQSFPDSARRIEALLQALGTSRRGWHPSGLSEWLCGYLQQHPDAEVKRVALQALQSSDERVRRGAARYWVTKRLGEWRPADAASYEAALQVMEQNAGEEVRELAVECLEQWSRTRVLPAPLAAGHLRVALHDPDVKARQQAMSAIGHYWPQLAPELMPIAGGKALPLRPNRPLAEDEKNEVVRYYTSPYEDWEAAALALGWARHTPARALLHKRPETPARELALALLGETQRLRPSHFEARSNDEAVEAVIRDLGRHQLALAIEQPGEHVGELRQMLLAQHPPGSPVLRRVQTEKELQAWWKQYGRKWRRS